MFIDDVFAIWLLCGNKKGSDEVFCRFNQDINQIGWLRWVTEELTFLANFLDLTISTNHSSDNMYKTFKKMNLYLYIPPHSDHPPGIIKSHIYVILRNYWFQNTCKHNYIKLVKAFSERLVAKGHNANNI